MKSLPIHFFALGTSALGLASLTFSKELNPWLVCFCFCFWFAARLFRWQFSEKNLLSFALGSLALVATFTYYQSYSLSKCLVIGLLVLHTEMLALAEKNKFQSAIMGLAFSDLVTTMVLNPDPLMLPFLFIFLFSACGALMRLSSFSQEESFDSIGLIGGVSLLIILSAAILFPLLPRKNQDLGNLSRSEIGYTETVNLQDPLLNFNRGENQVVMRIFSKDAKKYIPMGLLRGKTLGAFDGEHWTPGLKPLDNRQEQSIAEPDLVVIREELGTDVLPVPYDAKLVSLENGTRVRKFSSGEWVASNLRRSRAIYHVQRYDRAQNSKDLPLDTNRRIPAAVDTKQLAKLANSLGSGKRSNWEKIEAVRLLLMGGKYSPTLPAEDQGGVHSIDEFLFEKKRGHCELFSTSAAILLRKMDVPTRLVAGFRVISDSIDTVTTVYANQAHAWVEAWDADRGWVILDATPILAAEPAEWARLTQMKDALGMFWYRKVLSYDRSIDWYSSAEFWRFIGFVFLAVFLLMLWWSRSLWLANVREFLRMKSPREKIMLEYRKVAPTILHLSNRLEMRPQIKAEIELWNKDYQVLRFGREEPTIEKLAQFQVKTEKVKESLIGIDKAL